MYDTTHENGVLICSIHRTPISKSHGRFFCLKCQRDEDKTKTQLITELPIKEAADNILAVAQIIADYSDNTDRTIEISIIVSSKLKAIM